MRGRVADWVAEIRRLREQGRRRCSSPRRQAGRADDRAAEGVRRARRAGRAGRRRAVCRGAGRPPASCRAASGCRMPASRSTPRPTSSRKSGGRPSAGDRRRKAFLSDLRDLKVGDLVVHVDHGIGTFVGLKQIGVGDSNAGVPRAALRRRRQAVRAGRAAGSRPEVHRRDASRRSIGSAAPPGSARRPGSRRPCATWPRSC